MEKGWKDSTRDSNITYETIVITEVRYKEALN